MKQASKSDSAAARVVHAALKMLEHDGGETRYTDICERIANSDILSDYERQQTKSGNPRWKIYLQFFSIELKAVGYIVKNKGVWLLTDEGSKALKKSPEDFFADFHHKYKELTKGKKKDGGSVDDIEEAPGEIEDLQSKAITGIMDFIKHKNPYEFQDLVAALLRAMGYYTPFVAPKGKDGGVDIIAYQDPLGTAQPQLKVQVKHYPSQAVSVEVVRNLGGVLVKDDEAGLIVTSGTFTNDAKKEARSYHRRLRLIDINEFIDLWIRYYNNVAEADKSLLPIIPIYFVNNG